ncbi:MAG: hypothetical protein EOO70_08150 [Myxococcaceae bacterium]|nr:MAG: hypothetical protein EOO70_08150 [Myxococcaceae bacterium]
MTVSGLRELIAVLLLVCLTACGGDGPPDPTEESPMSPSAVPGLSVRDALEIAQDRARDSLGLWGPNATLSPISGEAHAVWCSDLSTPPDGTPVLVEATYVIRDMEPAPGPGSRDQFIDDFVAHWSDQGWTESFRRDNGEGRVVAMEMDGYVLNLSLDVKNGITVSTPCVEGKPHAIPIDDLTR